MGLIWHLIIRLCIGVEILQEFILEEDHWCTSIGAAYLEYLKHNIINFHENFAFESETDIFVGEETLDFKSYPLESLHFCKDLTVK